MPREELTQKIGATATALLGLTGVAADPVQSREHILISQLLLNAWTAGRDLDLPLLIREIEKPPISSVGAYSLETFFPSKDRLKFASMLNNVLASPSFSTWTMGEPLDLAAMLYRNGRPQQLIFYVAHLDDTQRMFFTTLLLEELLAWTRRQPGTTNLRALLYFDEVFGYLPPHPANPPSKGPLLTLPYSIELNDISLMIVQHQRPQEIFTRCMDYFERLYAESAARAKIMSIAVHPYISGTPFRIKYFEQTLAALKKKRGVVFWTGEEIMHWYRSARRQ